MTHDDALDARLRAHLTFPDDRLGAFAHAIVNRRTDRRRRRIGALTAAALLLAGVGAVALLVDRDAAPPQRLVLVRTAPDDAPSYAAPPGLGALLERTDAVVAGTVFSVGDAEVLFEVEEVIRGPLGRGRLLVPTRGAAPIVSCSALLEFEAGERCVLLLRREAATGRYAVVREGSGKIDLPHEGMFTRDDVRVLVLTHTLPPDRLAALVRAHGPAAIAALRRNLALVRDARVPSRAPVVQVALEDAVREAVAQGKGVSRTALKALAPSRLAALPAPVHARIEATLAAIDNLHTRLAYLEPLAGAGLSLAPAAARRLVEAVEAETGEAPDDATAARLLLTARAALHRARREPADARFRALVAQRPPLGLFDRGDALRLWLGFDPDAAAPEALAYVHTLFADRGIPRFDVLARIPGPEAGGLLEAILAAPRLDVSSVGRRGDLERLFLAPAAPRDPARYRDAIRRRLTPDAELAAFTTWLELAWAAGVEPRVVAAALRARLARLPDRPSDRAHVVALVRVAQDALGRSALRYVDPTDAELRDAVAALRAHLAR